MIYEPIEKFREQAGLIPSLDTHDSDTSQSVLLNFDDAKDPEVNGGYINLRLDDGHVYIECYDAEGNIFSEQAIHCSKFKPTEQD